MRASVCNALRVIRALAGSTNAPIHLAATAGRAGIEFAFSWLNMLSETTQVLVSPKPTGSRCMEDFVSAGGFGVVLAELSPLLDSACLTVNGESLGTYFSDTGRANAAGVIRPLEDPVEPKGGLVALHGSLAPRGAILKRSAADSALFEIEGRAVVFSSLEDLAARIDEPDLDVEAGDIPVLRNAGPRNPS